jgi:hypothetical protein
MRVSGCPVYYLKFMHGLPLCESLDIGCVQVLDLLVQIFLSSKIPEWLRPFLSWHFGHTSQG